MISMKKMLTKILVNLKTLNGRVTRKWLYTEYSFKGTKANEWEYIGKSITVPSGHVYFVRFQTNYASGRPLGVGVHSNSTGSGTGFYPYQGVAECSDGMNISPVFMLTPSTYYVYYKRATIPNTANTHHAYCVDVIC